MELKKNILDPYELEFKVGFEIHQQLATNSKLFCSCRCKEVDDYEVEFVRRLRPTQSELGMYDPAALFEFKKGRLIKYLGGIGSSCLVEADEEPPHDVNNEALETVLIIALGLKSNIVDEIHVMRKMVIDGSNTTGFQRTMLVATMGTFEVTKKVKVQSISLEEDAAKLISDDRDGRTYGLDRLGTPLIEVALEPITGTPEEIMRIALALGRFMRASRRVARGLGTIRQDVNISITGGEVIEVKGVQKLDQLIKVIEYEMTRQHAMLLIAKKLTEYRINPDGIGDLVIDITYIFKNSSSKVFINALENNGIIKAIRLKGFAGMLSYEPYDDIRLGKEFGEFVKFYGLGGIFHSDELPAYGIKDSDVSVIRNVLSLDDSDAFIIIAGSREDVKAAVSAVIERAKYALIGVPAETRAPTFEGKTVYSRPRPGAARMYPETDIPPIPITRQKLDSLKKLIPKSWNEVIDELCMKYGLNSALAKKIFDSDYLELFEEISSGTKVQSTFIVATLTESLVSMERDGLDVSAITNDLIKNAFILLDKGSIAKESIVLIFEKIMKKEATSLDEAIVKLGLKAMSDEEIEQILEKIVQENNQIIIGKKRNSISILMGKAMNILRGKVDGQKVNVLLRKKIEDMIGGTVED
ncbi:MAG: Glu-tRNA(Gln) amidotransferase subunit GatE [Thaumarchaeota archaeon]|nr:Glu-tRNA(Gln) amidotransferase subunit GatE [Nitrososphaerota archaeon]